MKKRKRKKRWKMKTKMMKKTRKCKMKAKMFKRKREREDHEISSLNLTAESSSRLDTETLILTSLTPFTTMVLSTTADLLLIRISKQPINQFSLPVLFVSSPEDTSLFLKENSSDLTDSTGEKWDQDSQDRSSTSTIQQLQQVLQSNQASRMMSFQVSSCLRAWEDESQEDLFTITLRRQML